MKPASAPRSAAGGAETAGPNRFSYVIRKIVGKRPTYAQLIGKAEEGTQTEEAF
jgi:hypothetical protein